MIINNITENIGDYLRRKRVNLTELSKKTGIHYNSLYASVWDRSRRRDLRANELMSICGARNQSNGFYSLRHK